MVAKNRTSKPMRSGYTTGACAAAAAQAAASALVNQAVVNRVEIELPQGNKADFDIKSCSFDQRQAICSVIKDAGDDPDATNGAEIYAILSWKAASGIKIRGGKGVGVVTKPGLEIPIGMPAINPVPHLMISDAVKRETERYLNGRGIQVVIFVPQGEELAKRTLNARLGIVGGISILGTTGIVIPYSVNAYTACISQALDVAAACGCRQVVLTTGRRSEKFAQSQLVTLDEECFIQAGDFIGYSLEQCAKRSFDKVIVWGMVGKTSKLAAGHLYTNVSDSTVDISFLIEVAASCGVPVETVENLQTAVTANHFRRILPAAYIPEFCNQLCRLAARNCQEKTDGVLAVECIMTDAEGIILGRANAGE
jgi:cobalt-precorrin-5B (C1)-methyltransferase